MDTLEKKWLGEYIINIYAKLPFCRSLGDCIGKMLKYFIENLEGPVPKDSVAD